MTWTQSGCSELCSLWGALTGPQTRNSSRVSWRFRLTCDWGSDAPSSTATTLDVGGAVGGDVASCWRSVRHREEESILGRPEGEDGAVNFLFLIFDYFLFFYYYYLIGFSSVTVVHHLFIYYWLLYFIFDLISEIAADWPEISESLSPGFNISK